MMQKLLEQKLKKLWTWGYLLLKTINFKANIFYVFYKRVISELYFENLKNFDITCTRKKKICKICEIVILCLNSSTYSTTGKSPYSAFTTDRASTAI